MGLIVLFFDVTMLFDEKSIKIQAAKLFPLTKSIKIHATKLF